MREQGKRCERGSVVPLAVVSVFILIAFVSFSVDQGIAYAAKARQENAIDGARASCMDASFALAAKNDEDPARAVARQVTESVRAQGFSGSVTVWFYEAPRDAMPRSQRLWVVGIQLQEDVPTVFARGFGIGSIPAASYQVVDVVPYASDRAWRPEERVSGRYEVRAGESFSHASFRRIDALDGFPKELAEEARAALDGSAA